MDNDRGTLISPFIHPEEKSHYATKPSHKPPNINPHHAEQTGFSDRFSPQGFSEFDLAGSSRLSY